MSAHWWNLAARLRARRQRPDTVRWTGSQEPVAVPSDWEPPSAALLPAAQNRVPR